jgi:carbonic anhydrase/acetyltransferase-like protein (isoleucine patch superfamily)
MIDEIIHRRTDLAHLFRFGDLYPQVSPTAYVADTAVLIGDVTVAEGASIWHNAVLRGDIAPIRVGRFSNVQDNCTVHVEHDRPAIIGDYVTVGHNAVIHGADIEDAVLIGMNATVLSYARVGRGSIVGANALVTERAEVQAGSLVVGVPARVVRTLGPEVAEEHVEHALRYAELGEQYRREAEAE